MSAASGSAVRTRSIVAYVHVLDVTRSIEFYAHLGFKVKNSFTAPGHASTTWAWLESDRANLMIAGADGPIDPEQQAIFFYLYCDDVAAARIELEAKGVVCGPISYPFYCPLGEFRVVDPDGYGLMIAHT